MDWQEVRKVSSDMKVAEIGHVELFGGPHGGKRFFIPKQYLGIGGLLSFGDPLNECYRITRTRLFDGALVCDWLPRGQT